MEGRTSGKESQSIFVGKEYPFYHLANICYHESEYMKDHIFICIRHHLVTNLQGYQLPVILIAHLVEHSTAPVSQR